MFAAKVVEVALTHKLQGTFTRQPALRFVLTGAAASTVRPPSFVSFCIFSLFSILLGIVEI